MLVDQQLLHSTNRNRDVWRIIKAEIGKTSKSTLPFRNNLKELASDFNAFFSKEQLYNSPHITFHFTINPSSFFFSPTTPEEISISMKNLKNSNSSGIDEISSNFLKKCIAVYAEPLCHVINTSFTTGIFPNYLKNSRVIPIYKKGNIDSFENYRPISLLTVFSKLFEKAAHERLYSFCLKHNVLNQHQHGFLKNKDINTALFDYVQSIYDHTEKKHLSCGIFLDLSKAFDTIDHNILIGKLERYGIRGTALSWFSSYLSGRQQAVYINQRGRKALSEFKLINCGVPQGSILGPLLFVIYFNDIYNARSQSLRQSTVNYADDTSLLIAGVTYDEVIVNSSLCMTSIEKWLHANNLQLNYAKTNVMLFKTTSQNFPQAVTLNNNNYKLQTCARILGVIVSDNLRWRDHISHVCNKIASLCYALNRLRALANPTTLRLVYHGCCYCHLRYGVIIWGGSPDIQRLFILQKRVIRIITNLNFKQSCRGVFKENNLLTMYGIYIYEILLFTFKHKDLFSEYHHQHNYVTRFKSDYCYPIHRLSLTETGVKYTCLKFFNKLPEEIKDIKALSLFKSQIFKLLCQLEPYCINDYYISL